MTEVRDVLVQLECRKIGLADTDYARDIRVAQIASAVDEQLTALRDAGFATITEKQFVEVACMLYCLGATDRVNGRPQNAVPAARQAWRELNELVAKAAQGGTDE